MNTRQKNATYTTLDAIQTPHHSSEQRGLQARCQVASWNALQLPFHCHELLGGLAQGKELIQVALALREIQQASTSQSRRGKRLLPGPLGSPSGCHCRAPSDEPVQQWSGTGNLFPSGKRCISKSFLSPVCTCWPGARRSMWRAELPVCPVWAALGRARSQQPAAPSSPPYRAALQPGLPQAAATPVSGTAINKATQDRGTCKVERREAGCRGTRMPTQLSSRDTWPPGLMGVSSCNLRQKSCQ